MTNAFWRGRKVLVTGASGFTGRYLVNRLVELGAAPRAFVRDPAKVAFDESVEIHAGDLTDPASCRAAVAGVDTVLHVAAVFRTVNVAADYMERVHVDSTRWLMEAGHDQGIRRFVHVSTIGVHSHSPMKATEDCPFAPADDYQRTKLEGELLARRLEKELQLPTTVVRPCAIYGEGDIRFLKFMKPLARGRNVMVGSGRTHIHFVHVTDLVEGILLAAQSGNAVGQTYILGGDHSVALGTWATMVLQIVHKRAKQVRIPYRPVYLAGWLCEKLFAPLPWEPPLHRRRVAFFSKNRSFSIEKARRELGYAPRVDLYEGMTRLIAWYRSEGLVR